MRFAFVAEKNFCNLNKANLHFISFSPNVIFVSCSESLLKGEFLRFAATERLGGECAGILIPTTRSSFVNVPFVNNHKVFERN